MIQARGEQRHGSRGIKCRLRTACRRVITNGNMSTNRFSAVPPCNQSISAASWMFGFCREAMSTSRLPICGSDECCSPPPRFVFASHCLGLLLACWNRSIKSEKNSTCLGLEPRATLTFGILLYGVRNSGNPTKLSEIGPANISARPGNARSPATAFTYDEMATTRNIFKKYVKSSNMS
jgi:hypothetical protein